MTTDLRRAELLAASELRAWARGPLPLEAAVELMVSACGSRLLLGPWARRDEHGGRWFDTSVAEAEKGCMSGGERRALEVAMSVALSDHPADLSDAVCGLDGDDLDRSAPGARSCRQGATLMPLTASASAHHCLSTSCAERGRPKPSPAARPDPGTK